jgi:CTP:molybdopterin cytidylyltransferase MocA
MTGETADMRGTVERGLAWLEERFQPKPDDGWLLAPADHPMLDADVVRLLCDGYRQLPTGSVIVPIHARRRGHPALIAWRHVAAIRSYPKEKGIDDYLRTVDVIELPVATKGVLLDIDTPADYARFACETP